MASSLLSLKWNNHRSTFFHILSTIRVKVSNLMPRCSCIYLKCVVAICFLLFAVARICMLMCVCVCVCTADRMVSHRSVDWWYWLVMLVTLLLSKPF